MKFLKITVFTLKKILKKMSFYGLLENSYVLRLSDVERQSSMYKVQRIQMLSCQKSQF